MKIAYICTDNGVPVLGDKGSSVHVREFSNALVKLGHEVRIYATSATSESAVSLNANTTDAPLTILAPSEPTRNTARLLAAALARFDPQKDHKHLYSEVLQILTDPEFIHAAQPLIDDWRPDLIIARHTLFSAAGLTLAHSQGCPCVLEVNAPLVEERHRYWDLTLVREAEQSERNVLPAADLLLAVSEGVRAYLLRNGVSREQIFVQPNGVNPLLFHPKVDDTPIRRRYGLENQLVIGFSGSLKPWHGVDMLLRAFASLYHISRRRQKDGDADLHLLIVGDGPQRKPLEQLAGKLKVNDGVTFTGAIAHDDIPAYLAAMDIAVAPYLVSDGFYFSPLKIMEYLAMGRAIVAPRLGQIPSLLQAANGPCGLLYTPDDQHELAAALLRLSRETELRKRLGTSAAAQARRHASWQAIAHEIVTRAIVESPKVVLEARAV
jgi:glycosyltransferase involved in cell wall biosynthesis